MSDNELKSREMLERCPVCFSGGAVFAFSKKDKNLETADMFYRCNNCRALFIQNRLRLEFLNDKFYGQRKKIDPDDLVLRKRHLKKVAEEAILAGAKGRVLDIGCGWGLLLKHFKERGYSVYGVDVSDAACRYSREFLGVDTIFEGEVNRLNFKDGYFDAITLTDVVEHLYEPHFYLKEIHRLLKSGGVFAVRTPNEGSFMRRILKSKWHLFSPRHIVLYNKTGLGKILRDHAFEVLIIKTEREDVKSLLPPFYVWRNYGAESLKSRIRYFSLNWTQNILRFFAAAFGQGESLLAIVKKK